jgi:hypothetical protein
MLHNQQDDSSHISIHICQAKRCTKPIYLRKIRFQPNLYSLFKEKKCANQMVMYNFSVLCTSEMEFKNTCWGVHHTSIMSRFFLNFGRVLHYIDHHIHIVNCSLAGIKSQN